MTKRKKTKATLRFEWSKDNSKQKLYIDFWPPIEKDGKKTRREFLNRTIAPLRTAGGEPILKARGDFKAKENDFAAAGVLPRIPKKIKGNAIYYSYSANDEDAIKFCQSTLNEWKDKLSAYDNANEEQKKLFFINEQNEKTFESFFVEEMNKIATKENTLLTYNVALKWFNKFEDDYYHKKLSIADITQELCNEYKRYIEQSDIKQNSKSIYFSKFKKIIDVLNKKRIIEPVDIKGIKMEETEREFLTREELEKLKATPIKCEKTKRICLFSALTGLRISDLLALRWGNLKETEDGILMQIRTKKNNIKLNNYISQETFELCGERGDDDANVFPYDTKAELSNGSTNAINNKIKVWCKRAGIKKNVSIHTFRHTYAVLQLEHGTSIETIRELMGHTNLNTTLIYAKVLDDKKKKASTAISLK